jgi:hypothetical protein
LSAFILAVAFLFLLPSISSAEMSFLGVKKILATDPEADDRFGRSVSISGDYAIVGASYEDEGGTDAGAAYIYHRTGTNTWDSGTKILAPDAGTGDYFGDFVSISGDYAIVGAPCRDEGGHWAGAAYIYHRDPATDTWDSGTKILAPDAEASDHFGGPVSISGDYAIVGAPGEDEGGTKAGAAYIYYRDPETNTWDTGTKILAPDTEAYDWFGDSVSISGDYAIVGASAEDDGGTDAGAAYIYYRDPATDIWDSGTKILATDPGASDYFGQSVSISGDYAIVGAVYEDEGGSSAGAAYIYHRDPATDTWDSGTKILATDPEASDYFGVSVSISGDYAIVGALGAGDGGTDAGAAYIYYRDPATNTWDSGTKILAPDAEVYDYFGGSVSISGDYAIVGAVYEDEGGTNAGAAYVYRMYIGKDVEVGPISGPTTEEGGTATFTIILIIQPEADVTCKQFRYHRGHRFPVKPYVHERQLGHGADRNRDRG